MNSSNRPLRVTTLLYTACLGSAVLTGVPAFAQSPSAVGQTDSQKTGVGPRGTKVGPSTNPAEARVCRLGRRIPPAPDIGKTRGV